MTTLHSPKKKAMSLLLAVLMLLSTAAPAFADVFAFVTVEEEPAAPVYMDGELSDADEAATYSVSVAYGEAAQIPEGARLETREILGDNPYFGTYRSLALEKAGVEEDNALLVRLFDISIQGEEGKVQPAEGSQLDVRISVDELKNLPDGASVSVYHFPDETHEAAEEVTNSELSVRKNALSQRGEAASLNTREEVGLLPDVPAEGVGRLEIKEPEYVESELVGDGIIFSTDGFSIYAVIIIENDYGTFVVEDENYKITITYTEEANLPAGTVMTVREVDFDTDEYWTLWNKTIEKLNEGVEWNSDGPDPDPRKGLADAAFFDVSFDYAGSPIKPAVPVKVDVQYKNQGIIAPAGETAGAVHIDGDIVDIINYVDVIYGECDYETQQFYEGGASRALEYSYFQKDFSVTGTYITGEYIDQDAVIFSTSAPIYANTDALKSKVEAVRALALAQEQGGLRANADSETPKPASSKNLVNNGDGTYTLSLSVTGKAQTSSSVDVTKSNVIIVMDRSNSMDNNTYVEYIYNSTTYNSNTSYYRQTTNWQGQTTYSRVYYRNGAWRTSNSNSGTVHNGTVYQQMSRLDAEQMALDSVVQSLLSNNTPGDPDLSDVIEISITSFNLRSPGLNSSNNAIADVIDSTDYSAIMAAINNDSMHQSTNWDEALQHALVLANNWKQSEPGEQVYVIFLTDGEPTANRNTTSGYTTDYWTHWNYASGPAKDIVTAGHEFYSIFTYGSNNTYINYLNNLTRYANGVGTYTADNFGNTNTYHDNFFNATDTSELVEAFNTIVDHINNSLGLAGVSFEDGIATDVTHTALSTAVGGGTISGVTYTKSGGTSAGFTVKVGSDGTPVYTVNGSTSNGTTTTVNYDKINEGTNPVTTTPATATVYTAGNDTYLMPMATMTSGGELTWDLAPLGMLEDGATYTISFIVWPDQDAYDYVANLNNGIEGYSWNESTQQPVYASDGTTVLYYRNGVSGMPNIVKYPSGGYAALTNTHQDLNYYVYEVEEHEDGTTEVHYTAGEPVQLPVPTPMRLTTSGAKISKKWNAELQMLQLVRYLYNTRSEEPPESKNIAIEFSVKQDGIDYKDVTLGWNGTAYDWMETDEEQTEVPDNGYTYKVGTMWQEDFALATGVMLSAAKMAERGLDTSKYPSGTYNGTTYYLLEEGHTYEVEEAPLNSYNFDMETKTYHPMLMDGQLMNVIFTKTGDNVTFTSAEEMNDGIRIDNTLRGGINLNKVVTETINGVSREITSNEKFEFTITLNNDAAPFSGEQIPWYSVNGYYYHDANGNYISASVTGDTDGDGLEDDGNILMPSNGNKTASVTLTITNSDAVRIANVPAGTTYTITETTKEGYDLVKIEKKVMLGGVADADEGQMLTTGNVMSGEIVPNRENNITFTNDTKSFEVKLRKVDEKAARLAGAKFKVYADEACTIIAKDKNGTEIGELTSAADSDVLIGTLTPGTYYLKETTAPKDYEAITDTITFTLTRNEDGTATVTSTSSVATVEVVEGVNVIVVENIHEKGDLKVSKTVVSDKADDKNLDFSFTVTLSDTTISGTYGDVTFANGVATFTLKHGESKNITGLPTQVTYTVTEETAAGFTTTKTGDTGTITKDATPDEAAFTNTREKGDLEVTKTVVSDLAADANVEFTFTVTLSDTTISGTYGDMTFDNGVATFTLKGGERVTATGLPTTVEYTVVETTDNGFDTTKTGDTGTISTTLSTAAFTNTRKTGGLDVTKTVESSTNADKQKDFTFTVTLSDTTISGTYGDVTFENGVATFTLKDGQTKTIEGLPISVGYTVVEATAEGFVTTKTGDTGTISTTVSAAAFTNTRDEGGLVVSKAVVSDLTADKDVEFTFTVTLSDTSINETYNGVTFTNGVATFTLKDGESKNITGLPTGITYTVVETPNDNFTTDKTGDTGTIQKEASTAAFTNTRKTGSLDVRKTVVSDRALDKDQSFTFTVTLTYGGQKLSGTYNVVMLDANGEETVTQVTFDENGEGTITLKDGEIKTIEGLPIGVTYKVTETVVTGFQNTAKSGDTGTITETTSTAAFTNTREIGDLKVTKTVVSDLAADADVEFEFTVTLGDTTISGTYGGVTFTDGVASFKLKDGQSIDIIDLPTDVTYTVVETPNDDFTTEKTGETGTISTTLSTAAFTNTRNVGELEVTKTVVSDLAADANVEFEFTVMLSDKTISKSYSGTKTDKEGSESEITVAFTEGVATVTLKDGEKAEITGLPTGVEYTVVETANEDFTTTKTGDTGTITAEKSTAAFTNTRVVGDLKVTKTVVSDLAADSDVNFEFTVTLDDTTITGKYGDVNFANGVGTFTLKSGESITITGLPTDVGYTVVETANEDFTTTKTGDTGTISTEESTAAFTNTRVVGDLEVTKTVESDLSADANVEFEFRVTLSDTTISGTYGGATFTDGVAIFTLKHGEKMTITGLPTEVEYTVVETANEDFTTTKTGDTGTISLEKSTAAFTNTRVQGALEVTKTVVSDLAADANVEFEFTVTLGDTTISKRYTATKTDKDGAESEILVEFTDGVATVTLKNGEKIDITGLPTDVIYTVVETENTDFTTEQTGNNGTITTEKSTAVFTNTRKVGTLEVTKTVVSGIADDKTVEFEFTVTLSDTTINGTYGEATFENGVATLKLKDGGKVSITGLPTDVGYTVVETANEEFATTSTGENGTISTDNSTAAFTNTRKVQRIRIYKVEAGNSPRPLSGAIFTIDDRTLTSDEDGYTEIIEIAVKNEQYTMTETHAPDGYNLLTHNILVSVNDSSVTAIGDNDPSATNYDVSGPNEDGVYTIIVPNNAGAELPHTGFNHPLAFTIAGLAMVGAVGAVLHFRKKDEE